MAATYEPIATTTLGSAVVSYTFSSVPSTYTDLLLICVTKQTGAGQITLRLNGATAGYYDVNLCGNGTAATTSLDSNVDAIYLGVYNNSTSVDTTSIIHINNYTNTSMFKPVIARTGTSSVDVNLSGGTYASTSSVSSVTLRTSGPTFASGSTFTLYGIKAA